MSKLFFRAALLGASVLCSLHALAEPVIAAAAWVRPGPPSATIGAAFMILHGGAQADRLLSAASPVAAVVELHTHQMDGGVAKMRAVTAIEVPAHEQIELRPGGYHLMLIQLKGPLKVGDEVPLTLRFEHAGEIAVNAVVTTHPPAVTSQHRYGTGGHAEHRH